MNQEADTREGKEGRPWQWRAAGGAWGRGWNAEGDAEDIQSVVSAGSDPLGRSGAHEGLPFRLLCFTDFSCVIMEKSITNPHNDINE